MSIETEIKAILEADSGVGGVATLLTGGIYTRTELGRAGLNKRTAEDAFDGVLLLPCALIRERTLTPDGKLMDEGQQTFSYRQVALIFFYEDGDSDRSAIEAAEARTIVLLHDKKVNFIPTRYEGVVWANEEALDNAHLGRATYGVYGVS